MWILAEGTVWAEQFMTGKMELVAHGGHPCIIGDSIILGDELPAFRTRSFSFR
jgi:hypothetical protein